MSDKRTAREMIEQELATMKPDLGVDPDSLDAAERVIEQKMAEIERQQQRIEELESSLALSRSLRHAPLIDPREAYRARLDAMVAAMESSLSSSSPSTWNMSMAHDESRIMVELAAHRLAAIDAFVGKREKYNDDKTI